MPPHKILHVEDHEDTRELIGVVLTQSAYEVSTAGSLAEALILAGAQKFDLFVLDSKLPDGTGVELCTHIRQMDQSTPILFCSALAYVARRTLSYLMTSPLSRNQSVSLSSPMEPREP